MIQLPKLHISSAARKSLLQYQAEINREQDFSTKVATAKRIWPLRSRSAPFREVKQRLTEMCSGANRCCYCEDSAADEVEHICPKDLFPEKTFVWENYLYACGPCNGPKNNRFAVLDPANQQLIELNAQNTQTSPPNAPPALINPREEDPLDFLFLDIADTFHFIELSDDPSSVAYKRAKYTIELLKLNKRDLLPKARKEAYGDYRARLREYVRSKANGIPQTQLNNMIEGIKSKQHPAVWAEMKRQHPHIPELKALFDQAPEALNW